MTLEMTLRAKIIDGDDDEDEKANKKKKLELQARELNEYRQARKEQMDIMVAIIHELAATK